MWSFFRFSSYLYLFVFSQADFSFHHTIFPIFRTYTTSFNLSFSQLALFVFCCLLFTLIIFVFPQPSFQQQLTAHLRFKKKTSQKNYEIASTADSTSGGDSSLFFAFDFLLCGVCFLDFNSSRNKSPLLSLYLVGYTSFYFYAPKTSEKQQQQLLHVFCCCCCRPSLFFFLSLLPLSFCCCQKKAAVAFVVDQFILFISFYHTKSFSRRLMIMTTLHFAFFFVFFLFLHLLPCPCPPVSVLCCFLFPLLLIIFRKSKLEARSQVV